jgi:hypothetical protein
MSGEAATSLPDGVQPATTTLQKMSNVAATKAGECVLGLGLGQENVT